MIDTIVQTKLKIGGAFAFGEGRSTVLLGSLGWASGTGRLKFWG